MDTHQSDQIAITSIVAAGPFHMPHGRANAQYKCAVKPRRFSHRVSSHDVTSDMVVVFIKIYALCPLLRSASDSSRDTRGRARGGASRAARDVTA